jgi:uncharacterized protein with PQ loop repeat
MFCSKCGSQIARGASFCLGCGNPVANQTATVYSPVPSSGAPGENGNASQPAAAPVAPVAPPAAYRPQPLGAAAPVSGIAVTAFIVSLFAPFIGLILGYVARTDIRNAAGGKGGRSLATAAIVIGWIFTILWAIIIFAAIVAASTANRGY